MWGWNSQPRNWRYIPINTELCSLQQLGDRNAEKNNMLFIFSKKIKKLSNLYLWSADIIRTLIVII